VSASPPSDSGAGVLTAEMLAGVGVCGPVLTAPAPLVEDTLRRFCQAAMETDPIHFDADAARAAGYPGLVAPPLYPLHAFPRRPGTPDPFDALADDPDWDGIELVEDGLPPIEIGLERLLNGGVEAEIYGLAQLGDTIACQSRYAEIHERAGRSGPMVFVVVQTDYRTTAGRPLLRVRTTMIAR
jgi:hydroxyacyl-ACP dehydratase HTD2-like protein with hotdog domain